MNDHTNKTWTCNRCGKKNRIRKIYESGEYFKTCKCGRTMVITVRMVEDIKMIPHIVDLRDGYRRCDRGTV